MNRSFARKASSGSPKSGQPKKRTQGRRKDTHLITDAKMAPGQDRRRREITYAILQFIRVPSLFLGFYLIYAHEAWLWAALVVGVTIPLPWVAVVLANSKGQKKDERERNVYKPGLARQMAAQQAAQLAAQQAEQLRSAEQSSLPGGYDPATTIEHEDSEDDEDNEDGNASASKDQEE